MLIWAMAHVVRMNAGKVRDSRQLIRRGHMISGYAGRLESWEETGTLVAKLLRRLEDAAASEES